ncbi:hypothetical protein Tco_0121797 [Tanacetum coccineum]
MQSIQRVLKYLKKTMDYSLTYTSYPSVLEGYTNASQISNTKDNSSTSGWVFLLNGVGKLSRYTSNLGTQHWQAIQQVLRYLNKTMDYSLTYTGYPLVLEVYTDASWISNTKDNSSTSG